MVQTPQEAARVDERRTLEQREARLGLQRVYTARAQRAHYLLRHASIDTFSEALCGVSPDWPHYWFGTRSMFETLVAQRLTLCRSCRRHARHADDEA